MKDLISTLAEGIEEYVREDLHAVIYTVDHYYNSFSLEATISSSRPSHWPLDVTIYGGPWSEEAISRPSCKARSREGLTFILIGSIKRINSPGPCFIFFGKDDKAMPRSGRFEDTCTTALDKAIRKEFPDASFYDQIEECKKGYTTIPKSDVLMETIDMLLKHGF